MKRSKFMRYLSIPFLVVVALLLVGCPGGGDEIDDYRGDRANFVAKYPVTYTGAANVSFATDVGNEVKVCNSPGTYEFMVQPDNTCYLNVSAEWFYLDNVTATCTASGSIEGYYLKGKVNRAEQVCHFSSCNDGSLPATGWLRYYAKWVGEGNVKCNESISLAAGELAK